MLIRQVLFFNSGTADIPN